MFSQSSDSDSSSSPLQKKGTLIFTGTLGLRKLAQSLAREHSARVIHVVHATATGGITDDVDGDRERIRQGVRMRAESMGW